MTFVAMPTADMDRSITQLLIPLHIKLTINMFGHVVNRALGQYMGSQYGLDVMT